MNINVLKLTIIISVLLFGLIAFAHEPTDMDINYSAITGRLSITVYHKVNTTSVHFIDKMEIFLNRQGIELKDRLIISQQFFSQPIRNEQRANYLVHDLNPGDKLRIVAYCNLFGKLEKEITISEENWQDTSKH